MASARPHPPAPPAETGVTDGLAWARFAPPPEAGEPSGGVVILHGADSVKENHADFAAVCTAAGLAALTVDLRGHGASTGAMGGGAIDDVAVLADVLRERGRVARIGLRGASMGGYFAIVTAGAVRADAVVAICPAPAKRLALAVRARHFAFAADRDPLLTLLRAHDETAAARALTCPLLLLHAEDDEVVPVAASRALAAAVPGAELVVAPGGHHRSVQHDPALQAVAVRFLRDALEP